MNNEVTFQLPHARICGLQHSSQNPNALTLISLHGWLDNSESFSNLFASLPNVNHLALDFAGHGFSSHRPIGSFYHLWDYVLDIVFVINQLDQKVWLMGHSMGGAVAMLVTALLPEKIIGLISLDNIGPMSAEAEDRVDTMQTSINRMLRHRPERNIKYNALEDMIKARMNGFTQLTEEAAKVLVRSRGAMSENGKWTWRHDSKLNFPSPFRMDEAAVNAFINRIECPVLLLIAKQGIYQNNSGLIDVRAEAFLAAKIKWVEGGHHFHLEPSTCSYVASQIQHFLDQN